MQQHPGNTLLTRHTLQYLQFIIFASVILYFGKGLLIPMSFGLLIAMVLYPACKWLERLFPRSVAIALSLSVVVILFTGLIYILAWQLMLFRNDVPGIMQKLQPLLPQVQAWLSNHFSISPGMQQEWLHNAAVNSSGSLQSILLGTFSGTAGALFDMFITLIYAALFLYNRATFVTFLRRAIGKRSRVKLDIILNETVQTYSGFIKGMILVYIIVGVLNSIGLYALGIKHAILFGMITAIMTIIPYIGIIISALLPISIAFITKDSLLYPLAVIGVFSFVQYLEANVIFPAVVGKQLNVSTWATLVAIIAGGILWGVGGMILFIPFVAILKIVTDHVPELDTINILLNRER